MLQLGEGSLSGEYPDPEVLNRTGKLNELGIIRLCLSSRGKANLRREEIEDGREKEEEEEEEKLRLRTVKNVRRAAIVESLIVAE